MRKVKSNIESIFLTKKALTEQVKTLNDLLAKQEIGFQEYKKKSQSRIGALSAKNAILRESLIKKESQVERLKNRVNYYTAYLNDRLWLVLLNHYFNSCIEFSDWVLSELNDARVDICYIQAALAIEAGNAVKNKTGCQLIFDGVEYPEYSGQSGSRAALHQQDGKAEEIILSYETSILGNSELIITGTKGVAGWYDKYKSLPKTCVIRNCLDYEKLSENSKIRLDCDLNEKDYLILFLNSVLENGGIQETVEALALLPKNYHLAILGYIQPEVKAWMENTVRNPEIIGRVHILPLQSPENLIAYICGADLAIVPLRPEIPNHATILPNRIFEAIMARLPLIISDLPYVNEILKQFKCGICFSSNKAEVIAEALAEGIENLRFYKKQVEAAAKNLCWENERKIFIQNVNDVIVDRKKLKILCISNRSLRTNRRMFRHSRTFSELGHDVIVMARTLPDPIFRHPKIEYKALDENSNCFE